MTSPTSTFDLDTLTMLRTSLRHVLTEDTTTPLATRLDELGWDEVVAGDPSTALRTLFEVKGDVVANVDALGPRLAAVLAQATDDDRLTPAVTVGLASPFGPSLVTATGELQVEAMTLSAVTPGTTVVLPVGEHGSSGSMQSQRLAMIVAGDDSSSSPLAGTDESFGAHRLTGRIAGSGIQWIDDRAAAQAWNSVVAHGRWLVACELVGIGRHVIDAAVHYTGQRVQYGRAIGTFQALQHRIASAHAMVVGAGHLATAAGEAGDEWSALVAKAMAGNAAEFACTQAQQCYGAIGFTWEHEFHRYLRRTYTLDRLFGDWRSLEHEIGMRLQATGVVPQIGSL
jgi:Acyl-CoA dehydrogenase, C-terminal domain